MSKTQRLALVAAAVTVVVAAFVIAKPGDDDESSGRSSAATAPAGTDTRTGTTTQPSPAPEVNRIRLSNGGVVGGARKIEAENGDTVRITVTSDAPDDIHLHGYDIERAVSPGRPARFVFKADIEGEFEIEAHDLGDLKIASVVVEPG
jgi:FtsP/CotA-like multicopper oxidase with cupredoxin domain